MAETVHIKPEVRDLFRACGLGDFDDFMRFDTGGGLNNGGRCDVQRLSVADGSRYYVKCSDRIAPAIQLRLFLLGRANSGPMREKRMLDRLLSAGFAAMEPVAWGEKRVFGLPVAGFLVIREVVGANVSELYDRTCGSEKRQVMEEVGRLLGRLHACGFFHPVRLKDLIRTASGLVLIDRETSKPWPSRVSLNKCVRSIVRSFRRTQRNGHQIGAGSAGAFLNGYLEGLNGRCRIGRAALRHRVATRLRRELHIRNSISRRRGR